MLPVIILPSSDASIDTTLVTSSEAPVVQPDVCSGRIHRSHHCPSPINDSAAAYLTSILAAALEDEYMDIPAMLPLDAPVTIATFSLNLPDIFGRCRFVSHFNWSLRGPASSSGSERFSLLQGSFLEQICSKKNHHPSPMTDDDTSDTVPKTARPARQTQH